VRGGTDLVIVAELLGHACLRNDARIHARAQKTAFPTSSADGSDR
jgi:hypothetical protein